MNIYDNSIVQTNFTNILSACCNLHNNHKSFHRIQIQKNPDLKDVQRWVCVCVFTIVTILKMCYNSNVIVFFCVLATKIKNYT